MFSLITAVTFFGCGKHGYKGLSTLTAGAASSDKSKEELEKENEKLKKENAELREQLVDYLDAKEENAKLWKYYELKRKIRHTTFFRQVC